MVFLSKFYNKQLQINNFDFVNDQMGVLFIICCDFEGKILNYNINCRKKICLPFKADWML